MHLSQRMREEHEHALSDSRERCEALEREAAQREQAMEELREGIERAGEAERAGMAAQAVDVNERLAQAEEREVRLLRQLGERAASLSALMGEVEEAKTKQVESTSVCARSSGSGEDR